MRASSLFRLFPIATLLLSTGPAACSGNGKGLDTAGRPLSEGGGANGPLTADFASIQSHVFTPICTVCHAGGAAPQGLRLDATNSYSLLVGVPSNEVPSVLRVAPGDPDNSYIIQKLEGHAAVGAQMPFGGPPLPAATIAVIRQWITDGAAPPPAAAASPVLKLTSAVPADRDVLVGAPRQLVVAFSSEIDQTRLDAGSVRLERWVAGGPRESLVVSLATARGAPATLLVSPLAPLPEGHYRLYVPEPPETGVAGIGGERLPVTSGGTTLAVFDVVEQR
jgi:hypothetical protein